MTAPNDPQALLAPAWMPRAAGVICHPTALEGAFGVGDLGAGARRFVDWLAAGGVRLWQVLPLVPVDQDGSPYASASAFAGDLRLLDLEALAAERLLDADEARPPALYAVGRLDGRGVAAKRERAERAAARLAMDPDALARHHAEAPWLADWTLFTCLKERHSGAPWWTWPEALRDRDPAALDEARRALRAEIARAEALEVLFDRQWQALREYARERGVRVVGDLPLYVAHDSAEVWARRALFQLDRAGRPSVVAGVPPDAFSETGQLWGNPIYDWGRLADDGYAFFVERARRVLAQTDAVRIDHFRGLSAYWEVPADAEDARPGRWAQGPGVALFEALERALGAPLPLVAEDLGLLDADVYALLERTALPGMRVLQFAFEGGADNPYLPHRYVPKTVAYTGTHDNDTLLGWWRQASPDLRHRVRTYLGAHDEQLPWAIVRAALQSVAAWALIPVQDALGLGEEARFNTPGTSGDHNWSWRLAPDALGPEPAAHLRELIELYSR